MSEFEQIPAGWFIMGAEFGQPDEQPEHRVWVDTFELAIDPVTRAEYQPYLDATQAPAPREWNNPLFGGLDKPVVGVSWNDAYSFCLWHSSCVSAAPVRLPTEAEWERAARGHRKGENYPSGKLIPSWIPNAGNGPLDGPWPVTLGPVNDFGIRGIAANVHEWCADWHSRTFYAESPARNPIGPISGHRRTSRGGSWRHARTISRVSARSKLAPTYQYTDYGFRLARDV